jgi:DNA-binding response OmpR family regulator
VATNQEDILVVEDDKLLNKLVCRYVQLAGFSSRAALDGNSALRQAKEFPPKLVLLDLMLPDITGFDVCEELKRDEDTRSIPIIMMTALKDGESRDRGLECGAVAYMVKPIVPDELIQTIKQHAV